MSKPNLLNSTVIPHALMLQRLKQSEEMRDFFIQMWQQNPALARQGGARVQALLSSLVVDARDEDANHAS